MRRWNDANRWFESMIVSLWNLLCSFRAPCRDPWRLTLESFWIHFDVRERFWVNVFRLSVWMFDGFWIDFQRISRSLWAEISIRKSPGMNFGIILSSFWDHGGALERWWGAWCWKIALKTKGTWRRTSILNSKVGLRISYELRKSSQRPPKSKKSCENKQSSANWKTLCVWRWIFGKFGCQNHDYFRQDSKIKLSIAWRCRRCKKYKEAIGCSIILRVRSFGC